MQQDLTIDTTHHSPQPKEYMRSKDTKTVLLANPKEIAKSNAIADKNDSTGSLRPIFDMRPRKINLQHVTSVPKVGKSIRRP